MPTSKKRKKITLRDENGVKSTVDRDELMNSMNDEQRLQLKRVTEMKHSLITVLISAVLFYLAFRYRYEYPVLGYLGMIPGLVLGFSSVWFFRLMYKGLR